MTWAIIPLTDLYFRFYYAKNDLHNLGFALETTPFIEVPGWEEFTLQAKLELQQKSERLIMAQEEDFSLPILQTREDREDFYKDTEVSISYTIPLIQTMLKVEYYYIDDAYSPAELQELIDNGFTAQILNPTEMSRHNLLIHLAQPSLTSRVNNFTDTLSLSSTLIINLLDQSGFLQASMESSYVENCTLALEGGYFFGPDKSEYSLVQKKWFLGFNTSIVF